MGNELARNFFQQRQGESFSTATPTHDCLRLRSSLLLHTAPYFSPTPSSSGASFLGRQHSLHSSTIVPAAVPLLHRAALCICHPWPFRPSASGSPLRSQPRSSPAADRHTRPPHRSSIPAKLSDGTQPRRSCTTRLGATRAPCSPNVLLQKIGQARPWLFSLLMRALAATLFISESSQKS